jgi:alpha-ribazole phosphatase
MEVYLIRHTTPAVEKGICYGQSDLDVTESFADEAALIQVHLPNTIQQVYSSPLQRCSKLAQHLFPQHTIMYHSDLMEINCGDWEMCKWDDIPKQVIDPWMTDYVNVRIPGGENYVDVYERVVNRFNQVAHNGRPTAIVAHGGVIRSILAHITDTSLLESFNAFPLHYGCVAKITFASGRMSHTMLYNIAGAKETHKPSVFK